MLAGMQNRMVLCIRGYDVVASFLQCGSHALYGSIVRFRATAGENHLSGSAIENSRHPFPRLVQSVASPLAHGVNAGWIAKHLGEVRDHCFEDRGIQRRGAGVVHINYLAGLSVSRAFSCH